MIFNPIVKKTFANSVEPESVTVDLDMKNGDQVITPSAGKVLDKATVKKPSTFLPENIKKGVTIAGVVGSYETPTETLAATANGEYTPPAGKHFSKVTVNVKATNSGSGEANATLTVNFKEWSEDLYKSGFYLIDGTKAFYYENTSTLEIQCSIGSEVYIDIADYNDWDSIYYTDEVNCEVEPKYDDAEEWEIGYFVTVNDTTASITISYT